MNKSTTVIFALLALFFMAGLVFVGSRFVQESAVGDVCVNPDWNTLQCSRVEEGRLKSFTAPVSPNTVDIPCGSDELLSSNDFCKITLKQEVGGAIWGDDLNVKYVDCVINSDKTFTCQNSVQSVTIDDESLASDDNAVPIVQVLNGHGVRITGCQSGILTFGGFKKSCVFERRTFPFVLKYNDPVSVANDQNCNLDSTTSASLVRKVGDLFINDADTVKLADKLYPGQSIPVVSSLNRGFCDNVVQHPQYGTVICTGNKLYKQQSMVFANGKLITLSEDGTSVPGGENVRGIGSYVADVKCCPQHNTYCDPNTFKPTTPPEDAKCDTDLDCPGAGGLLPVSDKCGIRYSCSSGKCAGQEQECFECLNSVACADDKVCDSVSHKCIDKIGGEWCGNGICASTENEQSCPKDCGIVIPPKYGTIALWIVIAMMGAILFAVIITKLMNKRR